MKAIDITGQRFGRLVAVELVRINGRRRWLCKCDCGNEVHCDAAMMKSGNTQSCGCIRIERLNAMNRTHGASKSPTYISWTMMIKRCTNPKVRQWKWYGGRGIKVCERWLMFENFFADMGERPDGKSIDRFPNKDGNYEPGNCRWADATEQANNRRSPAK